jgi:transglutaminase-like putative cysteine protease
MQKTLASIVLSASLASTAFAAGRTVDATYTATLTGIPAGATEATVWVPLPVSRGGQTISNVSIDAPLPYRIHHDATNGNDYLSGTVTNPPESLTVRVRFRAARNEVLLTALPDTRASKKELRQDLLANRLVTLSPRVRKIADEVTSGKTDPFEQSRAIYQYVMTTMTYDKTKPGWGKGDTERACDIRAGNCTDFHSLFMSLVRAKGIQARFVIGFPMTSKDHLVKGYHCWAEFWIAGRGWIPVDPSEASKTTDQAVRQYLFGNLDPDRVQFTTGRDLVLSPPTSESLNYFIYPRAEVKGAEVGTASIQLEWKDEGGADQSAGR